MEYTSRLGTVTYYDEILFRPCVCEPSMLFILGLESIISDNEDPYIINIPKLVDGSQLEVFDNILKFLHSAAEYDGNSIKYNCNNMKLFFNSLSDNGTTIPIIYHDYDSAVSHEDVSNLDFISNVFKFAGYHLRDNQIKLYSKFGVDDSDTIKFITEKNKSIIDENHIKLKYSSIYKLLDYKSMYSYALGVLYGCTCLGFPKESVFHLDPSVWYSGTCSSLVESAWVTFRFHYNSYICFIDPNYRLDYKYKGIQTNKIWNFDNSDNPIKQDEQLCDCLYVDQDSVKSVQILYSDQSNQYSLVDNLEWKPVDSEIVDKDAKRGISPNGSILTRYIANDEITISKAYKRSNGIYLSPNGTDNYFVYTGNLGWSKFDENSYKYHTHDIPTPTLVPFNFSKISTSLLNFARDIETNTLCVYYKCIIDNAKNLYGILSSGDSIVDGVISVKDNAKFKSILSDSSFYNKYDVLVTLDGYTLTSYYNIEEPISIFVYNDDNALMWAGRDEPVKISNFGYTLSPSICVSTYVDKDNTLTNYNLRYNNQYGYWSSNFIPLDWIPSIIDEDIYEKYDLINLYRSELSIENLPLYRQMATSADSFIYNDYSIKYFADLDHGFISLDYLYNMSGITTYQCTTIYEDDFGNSLLDEDGNPLVWLDSTSNLYWNSINNYNIWQSDKPIRYNIYVYDSLAFEKLPAYDNFTDRLLYVNGIQFNYADFYSHSNNGVIRDTKLVFKPGDTLILDHCYYDSYIDKYCIPEITDYWTEKHQIEDGGYTFVDGVLTAYRGDTEVALVYDIDHED